MNVSNIKLLLNSPAQLKWQAYHGRPIDPNTAKRLDRSASLEAGLLESLKSSEQLHYVESPKDTFDNATIDAYFVKNPDKMYRSLMQASVSDNDVFLGNCATDSSLVQDYISQIESYNIDSGKLTFRQRDEAVTVYVLVDESTSYEELESLNKAIQDTKQKSYGDSFVFVIKESELESRMTASFYSRVFPHSKPETELKLKLTQKINKENESQEIVSKKSFQELSQTVSISENGDQINLDCRFNKFVRALFKENKWDASKALTLIFEEEALNPDHQWIQDCLNLTAMLPLYDIDLSAYPNLKVRFQQKVKQDTEARLQQLIDKQQVLYGLPEDKKDLFHVTTTRATKLNASEDVVRGENNTKIFSNKVISADLYVNTWLDETALEQVLAYLENNPSKKLFLGSPRCISGDSLNAIGNIQEESLAIGQPVKTVHVNDVFDLVAKNPESFFQYSPEHRPNTILAKGFPDAANNYLITEIQAGEEQLLIQDIADAQGHFYMTEAVYQHITAQGPLMDTSCITCIDFDKENLKKRVQEHLNPSLNDLLSDTVLLRITNFMHRGLSLEQAIYLALIKGLKKENWPRKFKSIQPPDEDKLEIISYAYSDSGVVGKKRKAEALYLSVEDMADLSMMPKQTVQQKFEKTTLKQLVLVDAIKDLSPEKLKALISLGGVFAYPVFEKEDKSKVVESFKLKEPVFYTDKTFFIGSQQKKMLTAIESYRENYNSDPSIVRCNSFFSKGEPGTGKDEVVGFLGNSKHYKVLFQGEFDSNKFLEYQQIIQNYSSTAALGIINLQEINLSEAKVELFKSLANFALSYPNIIIIATANDFPSRASTDELSEMLETITVNCLGDEDIQEFIKQRIPDCDEKIITVLCEYKPRERVNFRLLDDFCKDLIKGLEAKVCLEKYFYRIKLDLLKDNENPVLFKAECKPGMPAKPSQVPNEEVVQVQKQAGSAKPVAASEETKITATPQAVPQAHSPAKDPEKLGLQPVTEKEAQAKQLERRLSASNYVSESCPVNIIHIPPSLERSKFLNKLREIMMSFYSYFEMSSENKITLGVFVLAIILDRLKLMDKFVGTDQVSKADARLELDRSDLTIPKTHEFPMVMGTPNPSPVWTCGTYGADVTEILLAIQLGGFLMAQEQWQYLGQVTEEMSKFLATYTKKSLVKVNGAQSQVWQAVINNQTVQPFSFESDQEKESFLATVKEALGDENFQLLNKNIQAADTLEKALTHLRDFYERFFDYAKLEDSFHPYDVKGFNDWVSKFLRVKIGQCSHFNQFGVLLITALTEFKLFTIDLKRCDADDTHERIAYWDQNGELKAFELTPSPKLSQKNTLETQYAEDAHKKVQKLRTIQAAEDLSSIAQDPSQSLQSIGAKDALLNAALENDVEKFNNVLNEGAVISEELLQVSSEDRVDSKIKEALAYRLKTLNNLLDQSVYKNDFITVRQILEHKGLSLIRDSGESLIAYCVYLISKKRVNIGILQALIDYSTDTIDLTNNGFPSALQRAIDSGLEDSVSLLLDAGASIDQKYSNGDGILARAIDKQNKAIVEMILEKYQHNNKIIANDVNIRNMMEKKDGLPEIKKAVQEAIQKQEAALTLYINYNLMKFYCMLGLSVALLCCLVNFAKQKPKIKIERQPSDKLASPVGKKKISKTRAPKRPSKQIEEEVSQQKPKILTFSLKMPLVSPLQIGVPGIKDWARWEMTKLKDVKLTYTNNKPLSLQELKRLNLSVANLYAILNEKGNLTQFKSIVSDDIFQLLEKHGQNARVLNEIERLKSGTASQKERAAETLANMAANNQANKEAIREAGAIPLLIQMLKNGTDAQKERAAGTLGNMAANNQVNEEAIRESAAIPLLTEMLKSGTDAQKEIATYTLGNLACNNQANKDAIRDAGAIPPLKEMLESGTAAQKENAAGTLGKMAAKNRDNQEAIREAGAIPPLIQILRDGTDAQKENAANTLGNLAYDNQANQEAIRELGAISLLTEMLKDGTDAQKENAANTLGNLAHINQINQQVIGEAGAIPLLTQILRGGTAAQIRATYVLSILAFDNQANQDEIRQAAAIPLLTEMLESGTDDQKEEAATTLGILAYDNQANQEAIREAAAIPPLIQMLRDGTDAQKEIATHTLGHLVSDDKSVQNTIRNECKIYLVKMIKSGKDNQKKAAEKLFSLVGYPANYQILYFFY